MTYRTYAKPRKLYRSRDAVLLGVCGGLAEYFDFSPWGVRLLCVLLQFTVAPFLFLVYIAAALIMKKDPAPWEGY